MRTGTIDNGILALIRHTAGMRFSLSQCCYSFSLGGAVFGMGERRCLCHYHRAADGPAGL
ncbi:hypothetical protein ACNKHK_15130 [Shigella flexneri]